MEEVAKKVPAPAVTKSVLKMPAAPAVTKVSADGQKTVEDNESVTVVKPVLKPKAKEAESTVTVDEDESDD